MTEQKEAYMSVESIISKVSAGSIEEEKGYKGTKATFIVGDKKTHIFSDGTVCRVNGKEVAEYMPPRKVDKIILTG